MFVRLDQINRIPSLKKNQTLTIGYRTLIIHTKKYLPESITTMLWIYAPKDFSEQLDKLKVDNDGVITMDNFVGTKTEITPKKPHIGMPSLYLE